MKFSDAFGTLSVKDPAYGAVGDGVTDDTAAIQACLNAAYGTSASPHGGSFSLNRAVFFPAGTYKVTGNPALTITNAQGAHLIGAGRFTTTITNTTSGGTLLQTDGFQYSVIENICFIGTGSGSVGLALQHQTVGRFPVQSNTIRDCYFQEQDRGVVLTSIADGGGSFGQGSENLFLNCYWITNATYGLYLPHANALQNTVVGGNFNACGTAVQVSSGSAMLYGVGFQQSTTCDVKLEDSQNNTLLMSACRSESTNFVVNNPGARSVSLIACTHSSLANGTFISSAGGYVSIDTCTSVLGQVDLQYWVQATIRNSNFNRSDWLSATDLWSAANNNAYAADIVIENIVNFISQTKRKTIYVTDAGTIRTRTYDTEAAALTDKTALYSSGTLPVTITIASPGVVSYSTPHGLIANDKVVFTNTGGALPTGITAGTMYFVKTALTTLTFTISATAGGAVINTSGSQSGTQYLSSPRTYAVGDIIWNNAPSAGGSPGWVCTTAGELATGGAAVFKAMANVAA